LRNLKTNLKKLKKLKKKKKKVDGPAWTGQLARPIMDCDYWPVSI